MERSPEGPTLLCMASINVARRPRRLLVALGIVLTLLYLIYAPSMDTSLPVLAATDRPGSQRIFNGLVNDEGKILEDAVQHPDKFQVDKKNQGKDMEHKLQVLKQKLKSKPKAHRERKEF